MTLYVWLTYDAFCDYLFNFNRSRDGPHCEIDGERERRESESKTSR